MLANPILLDANLLVLLVVGLASPSRISQHKRLRTFTAGDFELLQGILSRAPRIIVTPNVVTEVSNLADGGFNGSARDRIYAVLRTLLTEMREIPIPSVQAAGHPDFIRLGLTDAALLDILATENATLLTVDLDLYLAALRQGHRAENFNHHIEANR